MGLLRGLITALIVVGFVYCSASVPLGERTFFEHVARIWETDETRELVEGVQEKSGPVVDRVKRGVKAGIDEATAELDAAVEP